MASPMETVHVQQANGDGRSRQRLRPLLEKLLNNNSIPQLCWIDKEKKIWRMPWKQHKQTRWGDPDAFMLRELARSLYGHTDLGEPEKEKLKQWKELLRNALRSLRDVSELKDRHCTDGDNPYKVYQFINCEPKVGRRGRCSVSNVGNGQHFVHEATSSVGFSPGNASSSNDCSDYYENSPDHFLQPTTSTASFPQYGFENHCTFDNSTPPQQCQWSVIVPQVTNVPMKYTLSNQLRSKQMNSSANNISDNLANDIDDEALSHLVTDLNLTNISNLPSSNFPFRSRSPLHHYNEADNPRNQLQANVYGGEIFTNATVPITTSGTSVANVSMFSSSPKVSSNILRPVFTNNSAAHVSRCQTATGNHISITQAGDQCPYNNTPPRYPHQRRTMDLGASSTLFIDSSTTGIVADVISNASSSFSEINHGIATNYISTFRTGLLPHNQTEHSINRFLNASTGASLAVVVYYHNQYPVKLQSVSDKVRVCFVPDSETRETITSCPDQQQFGPNDVDMLELPKVENSEHNKQARDVQKILNNLIRGLIFEVREGDIYATRYCRAVPYFLTTGQTNFEKLERLQEVKIFDLSKFKSSFDPNCRYQNEKPYVRVVFAMKQPIQKASALTMDIYHIEAHNMTAAAAENSFSLEPDCSISDEYDQRLEIERNLKATSVNLYTDNFLL